MVESLCRNGPGRPLQRIECLVFRQQRPDGSGVLVGQGDGGNVLVAPAHQLDVPSLIGVGAFLCSAQDGPATVDQQRAQVHVPALADPKDAGVTPG